MNLSLIVAGLLVLCGAGCAGDAYHEDGSVWNLYGEIRKTVYHGSDWPGSVLDTAVRINLSYAFPM